MRVVGATLLPEIALVMHSTTVLATLVVHTLEKDKAYMGSVQAAMAGCASLVGGLVIPQLLKAMAVSAEDLNKDADGGAKGGLPCQHRLPADASLLIAADISYGLCTLSLAVHPTSATVLAGVLPMAGAIAVLRSSPASWASQQVDADNQGAAMGFLGARMHINSSAPPAMSLFTRARLLTFCFWWYRHRFCFVDVPRPGTDHRGGAYRQSWPLGSIRAGECAVFWGCRLGVLVRRRRGSSNRRRRKSSEKVETTVKHE